jgi:hypothetical protein
MSETRESVAVSLIAAQNKAAALFAEVIDSGMIQAGKLESGLSAEIHALAQSRFGLRRHWHKRVARSGPNTLLTYYDDPPDRRITDDAPRDPKRFSIRYGNDVALREPDDNGAMRHSILRFTSSTGLDKSAASSKSC